MKPLTPLKLLFGAPTDAAMADNEKCHALIRAVCEQIQAIPRGRAVSVATEAMWLTLQEIMAAVGAPAQSADQAKFLLMGSPVFRVGLEGMAIMTTSRT